MAGHQMEKVEEIRQEITDLRKKFWKTDTKIEGFTQKIRDQQECIDKFNLLTSEQIEKCQFKVDESVKNMKIMVSTSEVKN